MVNPVDIENIEELRLQEGIDDVVLREEIRALAVGDFVKLTFLAADKAHTRETLRVRITSIRGGGFRGKLADKPALSGLSTLRIGSTLVFTSACIHSVLKRREAHE